jgi:hypothetical protein
MTNNLPTVLHKDLALVGMKLLTIHDLNNLQEIAQDRKSWQQLYGSIIRKKTAEAKRNLLEAEESSRRTRNAKRDRERRVELTDGIDEQTGQKRRRIVLTAYTPLILRINLKRRRIEDLIDIDAEARTPPNLRRPETTSPEPEDFVDRFLPTQYYFV